jgi:tRNA 2-thiouridine synthesizing protein B
MSTLHTINKSPYTNNALTACLKICAGKDGVLLLEDGVFGATASSPNAAELQSLIQSGIKVFALINDLSARGLEEKLAAGIRPIDYNMFVQLTLDHQRVQSWY